MGQRKLKVLIVDDTVLYRKIIKDTLAAFEQVDVVGTASNGKIALSQIQALKPDLITLDQEMPELDGIQTLRMMKAFDGVQTCAVMVSAHTTKDAAVTMQALELGAFDFITKPSGGSMRENVEILKNQFRPILDALQVRRHVAPVARSGNATLSAVTSKQPGVVDPDTFTGQPIQAMRKPEAVVLGISTGGPKSLTEVIPKLSSKLRQPILIVQHMPALFTKALATSLNEKSVQTVKEAEDGEVVRGGHVYIAPGGKQMKVARNLAGVVHVKITDDPPENFCKPAADYLFRSAVGAYGSRLLAVIMTGMGRDGVAGLRELKKHNVPVLAQDKKTSVVFGMPMEAIKAGVVDQVAPLQDIATEINRICGC